MIPEDQLPENPPTKDEQTRPLTRIEELAQAAVRPGQKLSVDDLLANELAMAVNAEPLSKIRHTYEAVMLLDDEQRHGLGMSDADVTEINKFYAISQSLTQTYINQKKTSEGFVIDMYASIPWTFTIKEADKWLSWAHGMKIKAWEPESQAERETYRTSLIGMGEFETMYELTTEKITVETYRRFVARFIEHAMPFTLYLMNRVAQTVSRGVFISAMKEYSRHRSGKDQYGSAK